MIYWADVRGPDRGTVEQEDDHDDGEGVGEEQPGPVVIGGLDAPKEGRLTFVCGRQRKILNFGAALGELLRPRRASKLLRLCSGVRRSGLSLRIVRRSFGVVRRGGRHIQPAASPSIDPSKSLWPMDHQR